MRKLQTTHLIAAICMIFFASCSTDQDVFTSPDGNTDTTERIDMVIDADDREYIYLQSAYENSSLIDYVTYGTPSRQVDIHINIDAQRTLTITLVDESQWNAWEQEGGFTMYANRDLEDKQRYMTVELTNGSEIVSHHSHAGEVFPKGTTVNVFNILDFNPATSEMFARIIDLKLLSDDGSEIITINGTFRSVVDSRN